MNSNTLMGRKEFLFFAVKLSIPIMVQNLISTLVTTADTLMLGYVSQNAMAASSLANEYSMLLSCFYYGMAVGTAVLCAQYYGKGDIKTVERVIGIATRVTVMISALFFLISLFLPHLIMSFFTSSEETIALGTGYLRIISVSYLIMGVSQIYVGALRSVGKVVFPSVTYVVSLIVNIVLNACFIFGLLGLPKLGVAGVALGTVVARIVELIMCLVYSAKSKDIRFRFQYLFTGSGVLLKDFLKISLPSVVNDVMWGFAMSAFAAILGHMGDDMVAANAVTVMVVNIGAIACRGFANATTVVVSQELGKNNIENTKIYAGRMLLLTIMVSLLGAAVMMAIRPLMISFYSNKLSEMALSYLGTIMIMTTWRMLGEGINTCLICGCFRGGGDSRYGMILDSVYMWCVAVPVMAAAAYIFKLPPIWVYFIMTLDEYGKMPIVFAHFFKFKWLKNITREVEEL